MVVNTSAVLAILLKEPDRDLFIEIDQAPTIGERLGRQEVHSQVEENEKCFRRVRTPAVPA